MEIKQQMNKEIIDTFARRGIVRLDYSVDARTFNIYIEELKLNEHHGVVATHHELHPGVHGFKFYRHHGRSATCGRQQLANLVLVRAIIREMAVIGWFA